MNKNDSFYSIKYETKNSFLPIKIKNITSGQSLQSYDNTMTIKMYIERPIQINGERITPKQFSELTKYDTLMARIDSENIPKTLYEVGICEDLEYINTLFRDFGY